MSHLLLADYIPPQCADRNHVELMWISRAEPLFLDRHELQHVEFYSSGVGPVYAYVYM